MLRPSRHNNRVRARLTNQAPLEWNTTGMISQQRSFQDSTRREAPRPRESLPRTQSPPGTKKRTSFGFPGIANCGPDYDAETTTVPRSGDTSTIVLPNRNPINTSPLGKALTPSARIHNMRVYQHVKQRTNGQLWLTCDTCGTVKKAMCT